MEIAAILISTDEHSGFLSLNQKEDRIAVSVALWLQRISHPYKSDIIFKEGLCKLVIGNAVQLWNNDWISSKKLLGALDPKSVIHKWKLKSLKPIVRPAEIRIFSY